MLRLAEILSALLPDGVDGSISTSPLRTRPGRRPADACTANVRASTRTGRARGSRAPSSRGRRAARHVVTALGLRCNDRSFDLWEFNSIRIPAMKNLWCMLNFGLFAETDVAKRAFLYVNSICISGDF